MSIARSVPSIIAGSAAVGFGLNLGRDVYKGTKKKANEAILAALVLMALAIAIAGPLLAARMFALNYRTSKDAVLMRINAIGLLVVSILIGAFPLLLVGSIFASVSPPDGTNAIIMTPNSHPMLYWLEWQSMRPSNELLGDSVPFGTPLDIGGAIIGKWISVFLLVLLGFLIGFGQRRRRRRMFQAQEHNEAFLKNAGLRETEGGQFIDRDDNRFRLEDRRKDKIELFAIGRRNRRGYLSIDEDGRFTNWSGMVAIR